MEQMMTSFVENLATYAPRVVWAFSILIVGWLAAIVLSGAARGLARRLGLNGIVSNAAGNGVDLEIGVSQLVYYVALLLVWAGVFQTLSLTMMSQAVEGPLNAVLQYAPRLLGAGMLLIAAWVVANMLRGLTRQVLSKSGVDAYLPHASAGNPSQNVSEIVYWTVYLFFLPGILGALALNDLLAPVQGLLNKVAGFLPNLLGAAVALFAGWLVAKIVRQIVTGALTTAGFGQFGERVGVANGPSAERLPSLAGTVVYILILIPAAVAALNSLGLDSLAAPASHMLDTLLAALPRMFGAGVLMALSVVVANLVREVVTGALEGAGLDDFFERIGLTGGWLVSAIVGRICFFAVVLFSMIEAARLLSFDQFAGILTAVANLAGHILLGGIIFVAGLYLSRVASMTVENSGVEQSRLLGTTARVAILMLASAMALRQMGLANEIVTLAFGLVLGAVMLAVAIAFGIGGREVAARELENWVGSVKAKSRAHASGA